MPYNNFSQQQSYMYTAGKITILTTLFGVVIFAFIFLLNVGKQEFNEAIAQSRATTTVNVLNTPPTWDTAQEGRESIESSTSSPTNSGGTVTWVGTATDANGADYYMIICTGTSTPTAPTPNPNAAPSCANGQSTWAISGATNSGVQATAATTTLDRDILTGNLFGETNPWFAWVCDADPDNPRCFATYSTGTNATNSTPFNVNSRPDFTDFANDSPTDPGGLITYFSTSTDLDVGDTILLVVCAAQDFGTGTSSLDCGPGGTLASSTLQASDASVSFNLQSPYQDQDYASFGYVIDNHGHLADGVIQASNSTITVNNVAPTVSSSSISINGGLDITLTGAATQTPNFTLSFVVTDNNSCEAFDTTAEIEDYAISLYRSGIGSTTCDALGSAGYDPNNCYQSEKGLAAWNITCAATTTGAQACGGDSDPDELWECTFPLWYVADPTDNFATATPYSAEDWRAEVAAIDDDFATSTPAEGDTPVDLLGLLAFALDDLEIPYGAIEPGNDTGTLSASTTVRATGNVGIDEELTGTSMCPSYASNTPCVTSSTSTIADFRQQFATDTVNYNDPQATALSSTTIQELELDVLKSTATTSQESKDTYWGIAVPGTITLSGDYFGQNTFYVIISEPAGWY